MMTFHQIANEWICRPIAERTDESRAQFHAELRSIGVIVATGSDVIYSVSGGVAWADDSATITTVSGGEARADGSATITNPMHKNSDEEIGAAMDVTERPDRFDPE